MELVKKFRQFISSQGRGSQVFAALLVFAVCFIATVWSTQTEFRKQNIADQAAQEQLIREVEETTIKRFLSYEEILRGTTGLFQSSDEVTQAEFTRYFDNYQISERYPGILGFGFAEYVPVDQLNEHIEGRKMRGYPDYRVTPVEEVRDFYAPLTLSTSARPTSIGLNLASEPIRKKSLEHARDTGQTIVVSVPSLVTDNKDTAQPSLIMYRPLFTAGQPISTPEERKVAIQGFAYTAIRAGAFYDQVLQDDMHAAVRISDTTDGNSTTLLFEDSRYQEISKGSQKSVELNEYNRVWKFEFKFSPQFADVAGRDTPLQVFIGGTISSIFLGAFLYFIMAARANGLAITKQAELQAAKDELLSLASHQLRTPATGVKQYVGMLTQGYAGKLTREQKDLLLKAYDCNERQLEIINQILYVARADAGRLSLSKNEVNIAKLVTDCLSDQRSTIDSRNQKVTLKKPRKKALVHADTQYLRMAVENLISNASKYTPAGGKIAVTVEFRDLEVAVIVKDSGVGIDAGDMDKLFQKFSRIDNVLSTQVGGSGIGLYLSKQIALLHNGRIEVTSEQGKGSIFELVLPLANDETK